MFEDNLITAVKKNHCLWDKKNPKYRDKKYREFAWRNVSRLVGNKPMDTCRQRWRSLRDRFIRESVAIANDNGYLNTRPEWEYMDQMMFLKSVLVSRNKPEEVTPQSFLNNILLIKGSGKRKKINKRSYEQDHLEIESTNSLDEFPFVDTNNVAVDEFLSALSLPNAQQKDPKKKIKLENEDQQTRQRQPASTQTLTAKLSRKPDKKYDPFLGLIEEFLEKIPDEYQTDFKMEILNYAYKRFEEIKEGEIHNESL